MTDRNDKIVVLEPKLTKKRARKQSSRQNTDARDEHFKAVHATLLRAKAEVAQAIAQPICSDRKMEKLQDIESVAIWDMIRARAIHRHQIGEKLALLEELLHIGNEWFDQRDLFLLASARMDLEHLEPMAAGENGPGFQPGP